MTREIHTKEQENTLLVCFLSNYFNYYNLLWSQQQKKVTNLQSQHAMPSGIGGKVMKIINNKYPEQTAKENKMH